MALSLLTPVLRNASRFNSIPSPTPMRLLYSNSNSAPQSLLKTSRALLKQVYYVPDIDPAWRWYLQWAEIYGDLPGDPSTSHDALERRLEQLPDRLVQDIGTCYRVCAPQNQDRTSIFRWAEEYIVGPPLAPREDLSSLGRHAMNHAVESQIPELITSRLIGV